MRQEHDQYILVDLSCLWYTVVTEITVEESAWHAIEYEHEADLLSVCTADQALECFESN